MKIPFSRFFKPALDLLTRSEAVPAGTASAPIVGASRSFSLNPESYLAYVLMQDGARLRPSVAMEFYRSNSAVATAVDWIAECFEQIDPVLETADGSYSEDHEIIQLLKNPNAFQTWNEFAGELSRHYLLTHNGFVVGLGNVRYAPGELYVAKPQNVTILPDTVDYFPGQYTLTQGAGRDVYSREILKREARFFASSLKEIYHIAGFSSHNDSLWGDSPLKATAMEARQQIQGRIHNLQMLTHGGRPSLVVSFKDENLIDDDEHQERKRRIDENLGGPNNAGGIAVISGAEVDIQEVGKTNKDMDYAELDRVASYAIYVRYKVPLPLVTTAAATYNNMQTAVEMLYDFAVLPHADTLFAGLSKFLLPRFRLDHSKYRITYDPDSITALSARKAEHLKTRKEIGIETINELRATIAGLDDVEGGDVLYQPATLIPVGAEMLENVVLPSRPPVEDDVEDDGGD